MNPIIQDAGIAHYRELLSRAENENLASQANRIEVASSGTRIAVFFAQFFSPLSRRSQKLSKEQEPVLPPFRRVL